MYDIVPLQQYNFKHTAYQKDTDHIANRRSTDIFRGWIPKRFQAPVSYALPCYPVKRYRKKQRGNIVHTGLYSSFRVQLAETLRNRWHIRPENQECATPQTSADSFGRGFCTQSHRKRQAESACSQSELGSSDRTYGKRIYTTAFFKNIGARYKRIRLRPQGSPDPQCYEYKKEKLKELKVLSNEGHIDLFFGDESHVCTLGYVPYGWQFKDEDVFVPAQKAARLNLFGLISRNNEYHGFTAQENITQDKIVSYLDEFSKSITKKTVLVLDNASVHRGRKVKEKREEWAERGLFIFYLPPYSPQLNIAETLWRILKGKWIKPQSYQNTQILFDTTNRILEGIGKDYIVNFSHVA